MQEWLNSLTDFSWNVDVQRATHIRAVVSGDAGGALASPEFESSVNPIPIQLAEYAHHITASTPGFENLKTALWWPPFTYFIATSYNNINDLLI